MKVSELSGDLLDYWVAKAEGRCLHDNTESWAIEDGNDYESGLRCLDCRKDTYGETTRRSWKPSADWQQGGPIIEREGIGIAPDSQGPWKAYKEAVSGSRVQIGATPLEAAMRRYVASKFGEDVPDAE